MELELQKKEAEKIKTEVDSIYKRNMQDFAHWTSTTVRTEEYKTSAFIGKINLDMKEIKNEEENYVPLPTYYSFKDKTGKDRKDETLMANFRKINKEVDLIINDLIST